MRLNLRKIAKGVSGYAMTMAMLVRPDGSGVVARSTNVRLVRAVAERTPSTT